MLTIGPGEVSLIDTPLIEPNEALKLGSLLLSGIDCMKLDGPFIYDIRDLSIPSEVTQQLDELANQFAELLSPTDQDFETYIQWLVTGVNGAHLPWHTDTPGDVRLMTNLGANATYVDIAKEWDPNKYDPGFIDGEEPDSHGPLVIETGQSYVSNTLVTTKDVLPPHKTPADLSRVVLRTSVYATNGWHDQSAGNGITIHLDEQSTG